MINLSNYHSNGLPTAVWSNKVNLIGEKVYKPKLHFCEHCNKPILIYGRLIPCKHVFCFTCATLCLTSQQSNRSNSAARSPPQSHNGGSNHASPREPPLPPPPNHHYHQSPLAYNNNNNNSTHGNNIKNYNEHHHSQQQRRRTPTRTNNHGGRNLDHLHRTDSNHSLTSRDNHNERHQSIISNIDESTNNTTPTTNQQDMSIDSPTEGSPTVNKGGGSSKGCHRCGGRALRVERNTLNSIFVCQIETCRRTYLSARDLQAHVNHRHARGKSGKSNPSASIAAISSSPYISSSTLMHLNNQHSSTTASRDHNDHPEHHNNSRRAGKNSQSNSNHHPPYHGRHERDGASSRGHPRDRDRFRDRDNYQRDRERERDSKEYHRQSLQRAAQWAEQSAQIMEKGLTR